MKILKHLKNVLLAVLPIAAIVVIVDLCFCSLGNLVPFLIGAAALVVGETLFLSAVDDSVVRMGEIVSGTASKKNGLVLILLFALVFGVLSTIAEPDIQVLSVEIALFGVSIPRTTFVLIVGLGVGVFCVLGALRSHFNLPVWIFMLVLYGIVFVLALFVPSTELAVAFDAGSASTGVVASPFLIALCSGLGARSGKRQSSFGMIGIASIGPVFAVLLMFLISPSGGSAGIVGALGLESGNLFLDALISVAIAVGPMMFVFFVFEVAFVRVSWRENLRILLATLVMSIGLFLMIVGLEFGFVAIAKELGEFLGGKNLIVVVLILSAVFGFCIAFAEPAVSVLGKQVEQETNRNVRSILVVVAVGVSLVLGMGLAILTIVLDWNIAYVLLCVLGLSLFLMIFAPGTFVAISFDSGGVALGPTSSAFLFPMLLGFASALGRNASFGTLALLGLVPCVVLQTIGVIFALKTHSIRIFVPVSFRRRRAFSGVDKYSEIDELENEIAQRYGDEE